MTREEAIKFLALTKVAYPTAYKDMDKANKIATVNMWQSTFANIPYAIMELAFDQFRRVSKFAPTVADMYEMLNKLYYKASGDALIISSVDGDKEVLKRCNWIMAHTSPYRGDNANYKINYSLIGEKELAMLPDNDQPTGLLGTSNEDL